MLELEKFLSNKFIALASFVAVPLAFYADFIGSNILYALSLSLVLALVFLAIFDEYKTKKIYSQPNIPIPLVFNISNPANSKNSLNLLFDKLSQNFKDHKKKFRKIF